MTRVIRGTLGVRPVGMFSGSKLAPKMRADKPFVPPRPIDDDPEEPGAHESPLAVCRFAVVYGPPRAGVTTLLEILLGATRTPFVVVETLAAGYALDPTGGGVVAMTPWSTVWLEPNRDAPGRDLGPNAGAVRAARDVSAFEGLIAIRVDADDRDLAKRGAPRDKVAAWRFWFANLESHLDTLCVRRATVRNMELEVAACHLAHHLGLRE